MLISPVGYANEEGGSPSVGFNFSFSAAQDENKLSIVRLQGELVSVNAEELPGLPPLGVAALTETDVEMAVVPARAAANLGLACVPPLFPESSQLGDWFRTHPPCMPWPPCRCIRPRH